MIVSRKPWTIYDVDVIGIAVLVIVALAACYGVFLPARANATEYRDLSAQLSAANGEIEKTGQRLQQVNAQISTLQEGVTERVRAAPRPDSLTPRIQRIASLAREYDVEMTQVLPHPITTAAGNLVADVEFSARGHSLDLIRLLDRLARENPYHTVERMAIDGRCINEQVGDTRCNLKWSLRFYMLPDDAAAPAGGKP